MMETYFDFNADEVDTKLDFVAYEQQISTPTFVYSLSANQ